ncbi:hypothetical protein BpHYR1_053184 [Brachionus plicatilis]|uniref:Uncharacterized protein n=1 Tax=Brachionus plicatilis TaxID=10195 RepID=A0A3M7S2F6_BRAPC|nr:hypothetical protein BpHYR1_053184 [Brachionus plicatilis]
MCRTRGEESNDISTTPNRVKNSRFRCFKVLGYVLGASSNGIGPKNHLISPNNISFNPFSRIRL